MSDPFAKINTLAAPTIYERPPDFGPNPSFVEQVRRQWGGAIQPYSLTELRWYQSDVETAAHMADGGDLSWAARLWRASSTDGVIRGVLSTRTSGLVRLPKKFRGPQEHRRRLELTDDDRGTARSEFDELLPPAELAALAADGLGLGVAVGEFLPVVGREFPVFVRLPPEFLRFRKSENRWYYRTLAGEIPITPGDGRWVLHLPGGRVSPWQQGLWAPIGTAWIDKLHARNYAANWEAKLANPARVAVSPSGATDEMNEEWFESVAAWGVNSVFQAPPGYDVRLVESNGRGYEAFHRTIQRSDREAVIAIAGQEVTTDGGAGFQNSDIHKSIRADLIKDTADGLAYTVNTQCLPVWAAHCYGPAAAYDTAVVEWDVVPPKDEESRARSLMAAAQSLRQLNEALRPYRKRVSVEDFQDKLGVRIEDMPSTDNAVRLQLAPTDIAKVVRVDEARDAQGLPPIGDERGQLTITELEEGEADENPE